MLILGTMTWLAVWAPRPAVGQPQVGAERACRGAAGDRERSRARPLPHPGHRHRRAPPGPHPDRGLHPGQRGPAGPAPASPAATVPETAVQAAEAAGSAGWCTIHLFHRFTAYLVTVLVAASVAETWRLRRHSAALRRAALLLGGLPRGADRRRRRWRSAWACPSTLRGAARRRGGRHLGGRRPAWPPWPGDGPAGPGRRRRPGSRTPCADRRRPPRRADGARQGPRLLLHDQAQGDPPAGGPHPGGDAHRRGRLAVTPAGRGHPPRRRPGRRRRGCRSTPTSTATSTP